MKYVIKQDKNLMRCQGYPFHRLKEAAYVFITFRLSQLSYCPLACVLRSRTKNNKINRLLERYLQIINDDRLLERCLQIIYDDKKSGIHTVAPRGKLPPGQGWDLSQGQVQFQGWGATRQFSPREIAPWLVLGFGLELVLGLGGNFPRGQLSQN